MPVSTYESLNTSVLAYKRAHHLGRFDPALPSAKEQQRTHTAREIEERHIAAGKRCRVLPPPGVRTSNADAAEAGSRSEWSERRGTVRYVGDIAELPGVGAWVGVALDEPTGKNDGIVGGERYFECPRNCGVFVRPERVEVGDFGNLMEEDLGEEMEEM